MSAAEFLFWSEFRAKHGFPVDRLEGAIANIGAYIGSAWGGEAEADDLVMVFGPRQRGAKRLMEALSTTPGVVARDGRRK